MNILGTKFITFIFVSPNILNDRAITSKEPTQVISFITFPDEIRGEIRPAARVIPPWITKTDTEDSITPIPRLDERAMALMPSIIAFE